MSTGFLSLTGKAVGDTITITLGGQRIPVRITGEDFDAHDHGVSVLTSWQTLARAAPGLAQPDQYDVGLRRGTWAGRLRPGARRHAGAPVLGRPEQPEVDHREPDDSA